MIVTDIVDINKKKCRICLDEQFAFALYKGELRTYHIQKGQEIRYEDYDKIMHHLLPKRAILRAMNLLKERSYTRYQLMQKLREGFYPQECIDGALAYVESYGYIDDRQYAMDFLVYRAECLSRRQIGQKLLQKGIDARVIEEVFEAFRQDGNEVKEEKQIADFLYKKDYFLLEDDKQRQKVLAALMRKGYAYDRVKEVIQARKDG